jgi:adenylate cyclase
MTDLDTLLLRAPLTLTVPEVIARSGVPEEAARAVWAAMGFPALQEDDVAFTELDVEALAASQTLIDSGLVDVDTWLVMARTMGQGLAKLAEAQLDVFRKVSADVEAEDAMALALASAGDAVPRIEELLLYVWRRQFTAAVHRALATATMGDAPAQAVGFVDLVDYTRSSRDWDASRLERTLETFERDVALRVAAVGGRVVKTLGDGVLFTVSDVSAAVGVAMDTVDAHAADDELPLVRAGLACGPVLVRLGDVYGEPVNLASRLCDEARPSSLLVDRGCAAALEGEEQWALRPLPRRSVRGYRSMTPVLVRRA